MKSLFGKCLVTYGVMFTVSAILGYGVNYSWMRQPNKLRIHALENIRISKINNKYSYVYGSSDTTLVTYDLEAKTFKQVAPALKESANYPSLGYILQSPMVQLITGGMGATVTVVELTGRINKISELKSGEKKSVLVQGIAAVAGLASGYIVGAWLAQRLELPALDSPEMLSLVKDDNFWTFSKWDAYASSCRLISFRINSIEEKDKVMELWHKLSQQALIVDEKRNKMLPADKGNRAVGSCYAAAEGIGGRSVNEINVENFLKKSKELDAAGLAASEKFMEEAEKKWQAKIAEGGGDLSPKDLENLSSLDQEISDFGETHVTGFAKGLFFISLFVVAMIFIAWYLWKFLSWFFSIVPDLGRYLIRRQ